MGPSFETRAQARAPQDEGEGWYRYDWFHGIDTVGTGAGADAIGPARPLQSFPGDVGFYTLGCKFIDNTLNSGIMKYKPFAAWLVAELLFAERRPEPSFLT